VVTPEWPEGQIFYTNTNLYWRRDAEAAPITNVRIREYAMCFSDIDAITPGRTMNSNIKIQKAECKTQDPMYQKLDTWNEKDLFT
jgi:hypothetical protein